MPHNKSRSNIPVQTLFTSKDTGFSATRKVFFGTVRKVLFYICDGLCNSSSKPLLHKWSLVSLFLFPISVFTALVESSCNNHPYVVPPTPRLVNAFLTASCGLLLKTPSLPRKRHTSISLFISVSWIWLVSSTNAVSVEVPIWYTYWRVCNGTHCKISVLIQLSTAFSAVYCNLCLFQSSDMYPNSKLLRVNRK